MPSGIKSFTPAPFGAIIADLSPRIVHITLSGGEPKGEAKGIRYRSGVHSHRLKFGEPHLLGRRFFGLAV